MPILWNTSNKKIEGRYDGKFFPFAPKERKRIFDPNVIDVLQINMEPYGLVVLPDEATKADEDKAYLEGIKNRWKMCDWVVRNYKTMNIEREGGGVASKAPTKWEEECALEAAEILKEIDSIEQGRISAIDGYLKDSRTAQAQKEINQNPDEVVSDGLKTEFKKRGRPSKDANLAPASN
jgi:hypothetical protein